MISRVVNYGDIALGKAHVGLKRFGGFVKANIFTEWKDIFLVYSENLPFESMFFGVMRETIERKGKINFNISDVDIKLSRGENIECEEPHITEWELSIILKDKEFYESTIFYQNVAENVFVGLSSEEVERLDLVLIAEK